MSRKNKIMSVVLSIFVLLALVGCSSEKPEEVVSDSLENFKEKNFVYFATEEEMDSLSEEEYNDKMLKEIKDDYLQSIESKGITISDEVSDPVLEKLFDYNYEVGEGVIYDDKISASVPANIEYYDIEKNMKKAIDSYGNNGPSFTQMLGIMIDGDKQNEEIEKIVKDMLNNNIRNTKDIDMNLNKLDGKWVLEESILDTIEGLHDFDK